MKTKRVVAVFDVAVEDEGQWDKTDIALCIEISNKAWSDATVWDSMADFIADLRDQKELT